MPDDDATAEVAPPSDGRLQVLLLAIILPVAGFGLLASESIDVDAPRLGSFEIPFPLLVAMFVVAEGAVVHVQLRRQTLSLSLSEVPLVLGMFFAGPLAVIVGRLAGAVVALVAWRRQPAIKAVFNTSLFAFETCVVVFVFQVVSGLGDPLGPLGWLAALSAGLAGICVSTSGVGVAIRLTEGIVPAAFLRHSVGFGVPTAGVNVAVGLITATVLEHDRRAGVLLAALSLALLVFYRSHARLQTNHQRLSDLYAVTRTVDDALERGGAVEALLERTAELVQAEVADIVIDEREGESVRYAWNAGTGEHTRERAGATAVERRRILGDRAALLLTGRADRERLEKLGGHADAILVDLRGDGVLSGTMMVADRLGNVATFTEDDRRLFETLGTHASIALRNSALLERREHEALHDQLTGLPNRVLFDREVRRHITTRPGAGLAVMLIDLDRFKEVNDTLGHPQGDRLLQIAGARIREAVGADGLVARFGGDEFAVLVPCDDDIAPGAAVGERIRQQIEQPVDLRGLPISVGASIGVAYAPTDGSDADTLLQRADVALYEAKGGSGLARYDASLDQYSPERLSMVAELRKAIDRGELLVEYQPCIDLGTGRVRSAEALARWHHPDRGYVAPDVFIPIAERSGLIGALTSAVLRAATRQCAEWRREGLDIRVAVNLSARSLLDVDLPGEVELQLELAGLPATALVLEITESTIMDDPVRTVGMLHKLASMGITLSIDDYGTGYSSLAYLKNLPVDELKMDRSFITDMCTDERDLVIVRNTITLAHELGLRVVAEGVEDEVTQRELATLGCDLAQGYHISRPRTASKVFELARSMPATDAPISLTERRRRVP